jgi:hypothetical protein
LSAGEFPWASTGVASCQSPIASAPIGFHPTADRTGMYAQKLRDGPLSVACQNVADSQPPPSLQFFLETWGPHASIYACTQHSVQGVALLT